MLSALDLVLIAKPVTLAVIVACSCPTPAQAQTLMGPAHVVDGDTPDIGDTRIRLLGLDAMKHRSRARKAVAPAIMTVFLRSGIGLAVISAPIGSGALSHRQLPSRGPGCCPHR